MDAITTQQASQDLDNLVDRVIADVEPTTICNRTYATGTAIANY
ncbi:hypothetical protein [Sphaerospermopsis sp. FACHB-1194]|nr:hypothetical protein [Sphaerospermopsis sp. FACHB-1194]